MANEEIKKILNDMDEQGFPLEVKTSEILQAHNWEITNQASYIDIESRKNRTLDIIAEKNVFLKQSTLAFDIWLFIECKKVSKPWVFYTSDIDLNNGEIRRKVVSSTQFFVNSLSYQKRKQNMIMDIIVRQFLLQNKIPKSVFGKLAYSSYEPFTEGKGQSIHKARMQVCNAILDIQSMMDSEVLPQIDFPYGILLLPIIILDGQLLIYENGELDFTNGLYYHVQYHGSAFMIEIVTAKFLETYLKNIEQIITNFKYEILAEAEVDGKR